MKRLLCLICVCFSAQLSAAEAEGEKSLRLRLQEGLFEEEASRNLDKAADIYSGLLDQFVRDRDFAATAMFRLAEVRAKQGKKDDAAALYSRVLAEFPMNEALARASREKLQGLGVSPSVPVLESPIAGDEESAEIDRLTKLKKDSPDLLNAIDRDELTPLSRAASKGWLRVASYLLDQKVDLKVPDWMTPPLHAATKSGRKAMVEFLLDRGADINQVAKGFTPLVAAIAADRKEIIRLLLDRKASPNPMVESGAISSSPLNTAVANKDLALVRVLLDAGSDPNLAAPFNGRVISDLANDKPMPLEIAVADLNQEMVSLLLERGAKPNGISIDPQQTALVYTIRRGEMKIAEALLKHGALVSEPGLVSVAVSGGNLPMVKLLAEHGASMDSAARQGMTPLQTAIGLSFDLTQLVLDLGASPNAKDGDGSGPLHRTFDNFQPDQAGVPRPRNGVRVVRSTSGNAPAPRVDYEAIVKLLVSKGAEINLTNEIGRTPLHIAALNMTPLPLIDWMVEHGASLSAKDNFGYTPCQLDGPSVVRMRLEERGVYPEWNKEKSIHLVSRFPSSVPGLNVLKPDETLTARKDFDPPPLSAEVLLERLEGPAQKEVIMAIYRDGASTPAVSISTNDIGLQGPEKLPGLRWGDVLVFQPGPKAASAGIQKWQNDWRSWITSLKNKIDVQVGDHRGSFLIRHFTAMQDATPPMWRTGAALPAWDLSTLLKHIVAAEPRADLSAIRIDRLVGEKKHTWTVDARPPETLIGIQSIPVRLADGDQLTVPLLPAKAELTAARKSGIYRTTANRILSERIFRQQPLDGVPRTLGELVTESYILSEMVISDPDFSNIRIHRLKNDQGEEEIIPVDWSKAIANVTVDTPAEEMRKVDVELQWGDVVEINSRTKDGSDDWSGFDGQTRLFFTRMLSRVVTIEGWTADVKEFQVSKSFGMEPRFRKFSFGDQSVPASQLPKPYSSPFHAPYSSRINWVKVILRSGGTIREFTPEEWGKVNPWLRDGDAIEVQTY